MATSSTSCDLALIPCSPSAVIFDERVITDEDICKETLRDIKQLQEDTETLREMNETIFHEIELSNETLQNVDNFMEQSEIATREAAEVISNTQSPSLFWKKAGLIMFGVGTGIACVVGTIIGSVL